MGRLKARAEGWGDLECVHRHIMSEYLDMSFTLVHQGQSSHLGSSELLQRSHVLSPATGVWTVQRA